MKMREGDDLDLYSAGFPIFIDDLGFYRDFDFSEHSPDELYEFMRRHVDDIGSIELLRDGEFYCRYQVTELDNFRDEWCNLGKR